VSNENSVQKRFQRGEIFVGLHLRQMKRGKKEVITLKKGGGGEVYAHREGLTYLCPEGRRQGAIYKRSVNGEAPRKVAVGGREG